jgi:hypothetical protein
MFTRFANGDKCTLRNRPAFCTLSIKNSTPLSRNRSLIAIIIIGLVPIVGHLVIK